MSLGLLQVRTLEPGPVQASALELERRRALPFFPASQTAITIRVPRRRPNRKSFDTTDHATTVFDSVVVRYSVELLCRSAWDRLSYFFRVVSSPSIRFK